LIGLAELLDSLSKLTSVYLTGSLNDLAGPTISALVFISNIVQRQSIPVSVPATGSALAAASDIHRQMPTHMADIRRDWLTNQNTD